MTVNASDVNGERPFATKDALSSMGVDANYAGLSWTVGGVRQNSPAERSGLKAGDVIEAVNERPLAEKTAFESKFSGKTVRVRRDGKVIRIQLKR
jgi:S1-C subfamily serine protease